MTAVLVLILALAAPLGAWESTRVHVNADGSLSYVSDAEGNRIPDFGWVGYHEGCQDPPTLPVRMTLGPVAGDNTSSLNNALAAMAALPLQADGSRGALLLLPGTYNVSGIIRVGASGVVLRGSGNGTDPATSTVIIGTNIAYDATTNRGEYPVIKVGLAGLSGAAFRALSGTQVDVTDAFDGPGTDTLTVSDVTPFKAGDWALISHPLTAAWLAAVNYGDTAGAPPWSTSNGPIVQARRIRAVDGVGKRLTLAGGLFQPLRRSLSQATVAKVDLSRFISEAGVENLHVENVYAGATDEHHARSAVEFSQAMNSWARGVTARYYWHGAVVVSNGAQITVRDCQGSNFVGIVTGERGYTFSAEGQVNNVLFTHNIARDGRHNYIVNSDFCGNGVVFHDNESWHAQGSAYMEGHMHWSVGLLYDNVRHLSAQTGQALGLYNRGNYGTNHGWAAAHSVAWNCSVGTADIIIQKPPTAQNYAIGCFGDQITGVKPPAPFSQPTGYIEGSNTSGLSPASLYLAQLAAKSCPAAAASPTPSPTRTRSATPTATRSATPTATRSATPSPTPSATRSPSPSRTASPTPSATSSATGTASPTGTATPSGSPTASATGTATPSATNTATRTRSATASVTGTDTVTGTQTPGATGTASMTGTATPSATVTPTPTGTATPSGTVTETLTRTVTPTATVTDTRTRTATPSVSGTASLTRTPTRTSSPSPSATRTGTPASSPSPSPVASASQTATATASPQPSPSATPWLKNSSTPAPGDEGPLRLHRAVPFPQPVPAGLLRLKIDSEGAYESLDLRLYSSARVLVWHGQSRQAQASGWSEARFELPALPRGLYHFQLRAQRGAAQSQPLLGSFFLWGPA